MALPPIITNSPLFRILTGSLPRSPTVQDEPPPAGVQGGAQDTVSLSEEALRRLDESNAGSIRTENDAREKAGEVRIDLEKNAGLTLGSDSSGLQ